jgi:hypothetical protein
MTDLSLFAHNQKTLSSLKAQWGPELSALKEETERRRRLMALTLKGLQEEEDIKVGVLRGGVGWQRAALAGACVYQG